MIGTFSFRQVLIACLVVVITLLGFHYRLRQYSVIPYPSGNFDEIGYLWLGKSLINSGVPANWSAFQFYNQYRRESENILISAKDYNISVNNISPNLANWAVFKNPLVTAVESDVDGYKSQFQMVQPYLDNPPLTGIIFALVDRGDSVYRSSVKNIRLIPIAVASFTVVTVFFLGYFLSGWRAAFITALIFALGPGFVVSARMAVPENLIAGFLPAALLLAILNQKYHRKWMFIALCILSFIAVWLKVSGLIIPFAAAIILVKQHQPKSAFIISLCAGLGYISYLIYGFLYNSRLMLQMLNLQSARMFGGPLSTLYKIFHPEVPLPMYDGWIILGYLSTFFLAAVPALKKTSVYITYPVFAYLVFFALFGGNNYPWYQFIIFPILSLAVGLVIDHFLQSPRIEFNLLFFVIVPSSLLHYAGFTTDWLPRLNQYRVFLLLFVLVGAGYILLKPKAEWILRISLMAEIGYSLFLGIRIINNFQFLWPLLTQSSFKIF